MNVGVRVKVHSNRTASTVTCSRASLRVVMVVATRLGVTADIASCVSIDEWLNAIVYVAVRYFNFLSYFSNFLRFNINVRRSLLELKLARLGI